MNKRLVKKIEEFNEMVVDVEMHIKDKTEDYRIGDTTAWAIQSGISRQIDEVVARWQPDLPLWRKILAMLRPIFAWPI